MVKLDIQVKATLENVNDLRKDEDDEWHFKTKCTQCNEESSDFIYFNMVEKSKIEGSRGEANYIAKCSFCGKSGNIEYAKNSCKPYSKNE